MILPRAMLLRSLDMFMWQGGPGCSSMIGNFYELGPYWVDDNMELQPNPGEVLSLAFIVDQVENVRIHRHLSPLPLESPS